MCDAYDSLNEETSRELMRFHRKLAPYKVTFAVNGSSASTTQQLSELALVLARKIRKIGIACLLLPDAGKRSLESNFLRADAFGVPYTVVLNDKTLTDGILGIRNRDTTLKVCKIIFFLDFFALFSLFFFCQCVHRFPAHFSNFFFWICFYDFILIFYVGFFDFSLVFCHFSLFLVFFLLRILKGFAFFLRFFLPFLHLFIDFFHWFFTFSSTKTPLWFF